MSINRDSQKEAAMKTSGGASIKVTKALPNQK